MIDHATKRSDEIVVSKKYKYFMVFLCMLTQAIPYEVAQTIQPLFVHPIVNTFHFTLASYTLFLPSERWLLRLPRHLLVKA